MTNIRFEMLDISKYNEEIDRLLLSVVAEITERETQFRKEHNVPAVLSANEVRFVLLKVATILSENVTIKARKLIDDADLSLARKVLGLNDDYAKK